MFQKLTVFQMASAMAAHAGKRQALVAQNVANADTPDFKARDVVPFFELQRSDATGAMRSTRSQHIHGANSAGAVPEIETKTFGSVNGNTVSIEQEMLKAVETKRQHDRAISIYKSSMTILHATLGSR